jgi:hypothetical protein
MHLHISAFEFELGDVLLNQKLNKLFNFFLIHRMCRKTAKRLIFQYVKVRAGERLQSTTFRLAWESKAISHYER